MEKDKLYWPDLTERLRLPTSTCTWHDDVTCQDGWDCDTCGHQPPDDEKPNGKKLPLPIEWERSYGDSIFPMCPACGEMPYSMDRCVFCGQRFIKDDRAREWEKPPEIKTMDCIACGGKGTFEYTRARSNGHMHGRCKACGASIIE